MVTIKSIVIDIDPTERFELANGTGELYAEYSPMFTNMLMNAQDTGFRGLNIHYDPTKNQHVATLMYLLDECFVELTVMAKCSVVAVASLSIAYDLYRDDLLRLATASPELILRIRFTFLESVADNDRPF